MIEISFDQRIRELRDKADLSLRGLADQIDISCTFPFGHRARKTFSFRGNLAKLAGALDVSPDELKRVFEKS